MVRVLHIMGGMNVGGAETFVINVYRNIDRTRVQFDFLLPTSGIHDNEILSLGGSIYNCTMKSKNPIRSFLDIKNVVKKNKYNIVFRSSNNTLSYLDLLAAKLGGASKFIMRSTSAGSIFGFTSRVIYLIFQRPLVKLSTAKLAPSTEAGIWLFGNKSVKRGEVNILRNGVEIDKFVFNNDIRIKIRKELGIVDMFVVGHIGRLTFAKNHAYLIDIFASIKKQNSKSVLLIVGDGELEQQIREQVKASGLADSVIFTGVRLDIPDLLMAMDIFVFPSHFEGLPNTVVEAQATGLMCIVSDKITKEVGFTDLVEYLPIDVESKVWADLALKYRSAYERRNMKDEFIEKGYDIRSMAKWLEEYYINHG